MSGARVARGAVTLPRSPGTNAGEVHWPPDDCAKPPPSPEVIPEAFVERAIARVGSVDGRAPRWYALDIARTTAGDWVVVEINDGQRSGLSENDPRALYAAMAASLAAPVVSP